LLIECRAILAWDLTGRELFDGGNALIDIIDALWDTEEDNPVERLADDMSLSLPEKEPAAEDSKGNAIASAESVVLGSNVSTGVKGVLAREVVGAAAGG
jgi:hypothetical protein